MHAFCYKKITCFPWNVLILESNRKKSADGNISSKPTPQPPEERQKKFTSQNASFLDIFWGARHATPGTLPRHVFSSTNRKTSRPVKVQVFWWGESQGEFSRRFLGLKKKPRIEQSSYLEDHFRTCKLVSNCCVRPLPYKQLRVLK